MVDLASFRRSLSVPSVYGGAELAGAPSASPLARMPSHGCAQGAPVEVAVEDRTFTVG